MNAVRIVVAAIALLAAGCAHQVTFQEASYVVAAPRQEVGVVAVIDTATLGRKVPIRAAMTGIANSWEAEPGDMLRQVAAIELPQVFARYDFSTTYREPPEGGRWIVLELAVPEYAFEDFHAKVAVIATAYDRGRKEIMRKTYRAEGESQGSKMFWGGAFGMKSAIRQSSLGAFKKVFAELRTDLAAALRN